MVIILQVQDDARRVSSGVGVAAARLYVPPRNSDSKACANQFHPNSLAPASDASFTILQFQSDSLANVPKRFLGNIYSISSERQANFKLRGLPPCYVPTCSRPSKRQVYRGVVATQLHPERDGAHNQGVPSWSGAPRHESPWAAAEPAVGSTTSTPPMELVLFTRPVMARTLVDLVDRPLWSGASPD